MTDAGAVGGSLEIGREVDDSMLKVPVETPASPPNSAGISDAAREGDRTVASDSKIFRDEAARVLREARRAPLESQRNIFIEISATYKRLALDEERLRGEPLRSRERVTSDNAIQSRSRKVPPPRRSEAEFSEQHSPDPALRKTGISVMGDVPWGAHLCVFYETKGDLLDTAATYFAAGLESNEFCV